MADLQLPRGTRDLMPNEAIFRNEVLKKIEHLLQQFGFTTIDTPSFEQLTLLYAKSGIGEESKLVYELKDDDLGLRYDNTVSLARFVSMHKDIQLPFKRYYIGKVWRHEEPQHLRYREVTQVDADIVGGSETESDSEIIALGGKIMEALGIDYAIKLSDRRMMNSVLTTLGVSEDKALPTLRAIDKLDRKSSQEIAQLISSIGVESNIVDSIMDLVTFKGSNEDKLQYVENLTGGKGVTNGIKRLLDILGAYELKGRVEIDFSIVRGLDYYTGTVFEYKTGETKESICGGGRYDKLIGLYGGKDIPAIGFAIGVDRLIDILGASSSPMSTYAKVFVAYVSEKNFKYAVKVANEIRKAGINVDLNTSSKNLANQLKYASMLKIPYAVIIGDEEEKLGKVKFRNLISGEEETLEAKEIQRNIRW